MQTFGMWLRQQREARRISIRKLAASIGVTPSYICQIELGQSQPPLPDKARRIAQTFELNEDDVVRRARTLSREIRRHRAHPHQEQVARILDKTRLLPRDVVNQIVEYVDGL